jgi:glycosyltransferase involved in cell wall biosynthesis
MSVTSVIHVVWSGRVGGVERLVHQLAVRQREDGLAVSVAFGTARGPFVTMAQASGIPVIDLAIKSGYDLRPHRLRSASALLAAADVIHLHGFNIPLGSIAIASRRPIVFTEHGNFGLGRRIGFFERVRRLAQRRFVRRPDLCIAANSAWTAAKFSERYGIDRQSVRVIYNGIDDRSSPLRTSGVRDEGDLSVAFVGRLAGMKRVDRLLHGLAESRGARGVIVGEGPLEHELKALAASLGCESRVEFLGYRSDVDEVLRAADVLVQPSAEEPFGLAILEACRQGVLPIVFADGGGALEVIPPDGRVVRTPSELARTLDELAEDSAMRSAIARRSRAEWAVKSFPLSRCATEYRRLYGAALARRVKGMAWGPR